MNTPILHIQIDENGAPRTINKRVKVHMIAEKHLLGNVAVEEIAEHYGITLTDVYAALAYYHDNAAFYEEREAKLKPLIEDAKHYTAELRAKIEARLAEKESDD